MQSSLRLPAAARILAAIAIFAVTACADPPADDRSARVDALFARFQGGVQPGVAVLVVADGEVLHERTYGYADLAAERRLAPSSRFRLASVSKQFTTMAVMMLAEDGTLGYDDRLAEWLPDLAAYEGVTIRHLMQHTAGLPDYYDTVADDAERLSNADVERLLAKLSAPVFAPGSRYEYSNSAYEMLANIVERASGMGFAEFMRERIFEPLGMHGTLVHDHRWPTVDERVLGYSPTDDGYALDDGSPLNGIIGSGSMYAPLADFRHWDRALRENLLVSRATLEQAWTPAVTTDGASTGYGYGWDVGEHAGHRRVAHGGSWVGFRTHIAHFPDNGLTIVVLANRSDVAPGEFVDALSEIYLPGP